MKVYCGYAPCGCLIAAHFEPSDKDIASMVRRGMDVKIVDGPVSIGGGCSCTPKWKSGQ